MSGETTVIAVTQNLSIAFFEDSRLVNQVLFSLDLVTYMPPTPSFMCVRKLDGCE